MPYDLLCCEDDASCARELYHNAAVGLGFFITVAGRVIYLADLKVVEKGALHSRLWANEEMDDAGE